MTDNKDILFEVTTPLGFRVRVTHGYWDLIVSVKHPVMAGRERMCEMRWKIQMKSVKVNRTRMFICFIKQNVKRDGFAQFPGKQAKQAF